MILWKMLNAGLFLGGLFVLLLVHLDFEMTFRAWIIGNVANFVIVWVIEQMILYAKGDYYA